MTPITIVFMILGICSVVLSLFMSTVYSNVQMHLDNQAANKEISLYTKPTFGFCPTRWRKNNYTNGVYCIEPGVYAIVDIENNFVDARKGTCTHGKTLYSTRIKDLNLSRDDEGIVNKQYFCETQV